MKKEIMNARNKEASEQNKLKSIESEIKLIQRRMVDLEEENKNREASR